MLKVIVDAPIYVLYYTSRPITRMQHKAVT